MNMISDNESITIAQLNDSLNTSSHTTNMSNLQFTTNSTPIDTFDGSPISSNLHLSNETTTSSISLSPCSSSSLRRSTRSVKFLQKNYSTDSALHKINRRVISKPKKNTFVSGSENEIKKFYLNRKLTKIKPTCLETIFESTIEEGEENDGEDTTNNDLLSNQTQLIGLKKLKRSLSFSDGQNISKTLIQRRKKRIQSYLGGKPKTQKFTMAVFMDKLQNMHKCESDTETMGATAMD